MAKNRKDSFDFFLANERNRQSAYEDKDEWKLFNSALEVSPSHQEETRNELGGFLGKRASSEDREIDLESSENSYNLISFLVKTLIHKEKATLDELVNNLSSAYSMMAKTSNMESKVGPAMIQTILKKKAKDCLSQTSLFWCDKDRYWQLADKNAAVEHLMGMKESLSKRSETTLSQAPDTRKDSKLKPKRRYRRDNSKYQVVVNTLEKICDEYSLVLKNPFQGITEESTKDDCLKIMGSSDRILGIMQCYNFFAPLIQAGLKKVETKQQSTRINSNILHISNTLAELASKMKDQKEIQEGSERSAAGKTAASKQHPVPPRYKKSAESGESEET
jgi:hypothetical protein